MKLELEPTNFEAIMSLVDGPLSQIADGTIVYHDGQTPPSKSAIAAELARLTTIYEAQLYARNRKLEYDVLNQFELMTDDAANSTTSHADAIATIKTKWPKDNSGPV
jgi:hypothetical protein